MPVSKYSMQRKNSTTTPSGKLKKPDVHMCTRCGTVYNNANFRKNFYTVKSPLWESNSYKLPICNDCLKFYYDFYLRNLGDPHSAYRRLCMKFDMYYCDAIVDSILNNEQSSDRVGLYITSLNYARYADKTYDNTIEEENGKYLYGDCVYETEDENGNPINIKVEYEKLKEQIQKSAEEKNEADFKEDKEFVSIFGEDTGFSLREQHTMVKFYKEQKEQIPAQLITSLDESIKDMAKFKILQGRAIAINEMKEITNYSNQFNASRKYVDSTIEKFKKNSIAEDSVIMIGTTTEAIENFSPATIYLSKSAFRDVDGIGSIIKRLVERPIRNFFTGSRESDTEFNIDE